MTKLWMSVPWAEKLTLGGILAVGALLRLYRLDLTWFNLDQARDVAVASSIIAGKSVPLLGPGISNTQAFLGPLYFYLIAIPYSFARDPIAGAYFIALSNIAAIALLYQFVKECFDPSIALRATALYAVFPLALISSRVLWNPGFLPLFTVLFMRALYGVIMKGHSRSFIVLLALLAILLQLHMTTVSLVAIALLAFLVFRPRVKLGHVLIGMALFLLLLSPYLFYELSHHFENTRAMLTFATFDQSLATPKAFPGVLQNVLLLFLPAYLGFIVKDQWPAPFLEWSCIVYGIEALLFGLGIALCFYELVRSGRQGRTDAVMARRRTLLLLLWLAVPILVVSHKKTVIWWYYLDTLYPSQFIVVAIALSRLPSLPIFPSWTQKGLARVCVGFLLALVLSQGYFQMALQHKVNRQGETIIDASKLWMSSTTSPFGTVVLLPLGYKREILRTLLEDFGVDERAFPGRVHGAVLGLPAENEYIFHYLASQVADDRGKRGSPDAHYLVAKDSGDRSGFHALRSKRVGPYIIVEHRPIINYGNWSCTLASDRTIDSVPDQGWKRVELPASNLIDRELREREVLLCRGILRIPSPAETVKVAVSVFSWTPLKPIGFQMNGRSPALSARHVRLSALYWITETVFHFEGSFLPGDIPVVISVAGPGQVIGFDIYEGASLVP